MSQAPKPAIVELVPNGTPAPHDQGDNPIVEIDVSKRTCRAQKEEPARRKSTQGKVIFRAINGSHKLYFSKKEVFGKTEIDLKEGKDVPVKVEADSAMETKYGLEPYPSPGLERPGDPKIVIP